MRIMVADRGRGEPISLGAAFMAGKKVPPDVTGLLAEDHRTVLGWFEWYRQADAPAVQLAVARSILKALRAHMAAEEEMFYPEVRDATGDDKLVDRAVAEHAEAKRLMAELESATSVDGRHNELMSDLEREIRSHIDEEEGDLFTQVRGSSLDLYVTGATVATRRVERLFEEAEPRHNSQEEFPVMAISQEKARGEFVRSLKTCHATVRESRKMVEAQAKRLENYPDVKMRLETHVIENDRQLERIEKILAGMSEKPSAAKDASMSMMASLGNMTNAAAGDEVLKGSLALLGLSKVLAASYETLILFGEAAGEVQALRPLQQSLSEERGIAAFVEGNLRPTGMRYLQLLSEGQRASH